MKKKIFVFVLAVVLLLPIFAGCGQGKIDPASNDQKTDYVVTDLLGRDVTVPANPEKFVAIGPGCLRLYCYTADVSNLVGIEDLELNHETGRPYRIINESFESLSSIGPGGPNNTPDAEKLLVANPDVIFSMYNSDISAVDELEQKTGIPVVALSYGEIEMFDPAIDKSIELIGKVTHNEERASEVINFFSEMESDLSSRTVGISKEEKPLAYMGCMSSRGAHGIESTDGDFSIFNAIGARNAVSEIGIAKYIMLDKEKILEMNPDYIFIDGGGLSLAKEDYSENPEFYNALKAFKNGNVYMHMPYNYYYTNIGVAIADAYFIGSILYPEQFADVDPATKFDEIIIKLLGGTSYDQLSEAYFGGYQQLKFE